MLFVLFGIIVGLLVYKFFRSAKYWDDRNVVNEPALPLLGNLGGVISRKKHIMEAMSDIYKKYPNQRYVGIMQFTRPMLLIRDIDLIKQIAIKDFDHFHDHMTLSRSEKDPLLSKSLFSLNGAQWKHMRATLSPVFTSSKMRMIYQLVDECANDFVGHFKGKEPVAMNIKDIFSRFATDVIASTVFGIKINSLDDPKNSFFAMASRFNVGVVTFAKILILSKLPFLANLLGAHAYPNDVVDFFRSIVKDNIAKRERGGIIRHDLIHLLVEARRGQLSGDLDKNKNEGFATVEESVLPQNTKRMELSDDDIVAQALLFFTAGFEAMSTLSCLVAYELAVHPDVQTRLQEEIDAVRKIYQLKVPYETLLGMKYLDQVISETLRLWPSGFQTDRLCTKDFVITPEAPNEREFTLKKGEVVLIPIGGIHRDPRYYPNPEKFDPERFNDENKLKIVSGSYLPFGIGPRNCIASRFALLEVKTLFFHLLSRLDVVPVSGTQIPLVLDPKKRNFEPSNGFRLGFKPRNSST